MDCVDQDATLPVGGDERKCVLDGCDNVEMDGVDSGQLKL